jgi:RimJ/RimL family protein N-acetyltransferase
MVTIKARDFVLRLMTLKDAQGYLECHKDKEAQRNFMSVPKNLEEAKTEIKESLDAKNLLWAIEVGKEFAGFVHLRLSKDLTEKNSAVIGIGIHPAFRRRGLGTKATVLVTNYGFKKLGLRRICGYVRTFNKPSINLMKKSGFKLEGILRKSKFKDGKYLDNMVWAKVK